MPSVDPKERPPRNNEEQRKRLEDFIAEQDAWGSSPRVVKRELEILEMKARALDLMGCGGIADLFRKDAADVRAYGQVLLPWFD